MILMGLHRLVSMILLPSACKRHQNLNMVVMLNEELVDANWYTR